jgi:hypothetical protein
MERLKDYNLRPTNFFVFLAGFFLSSIAFAGVSTETVPIELIPIENTAFKVGEKLDFVIKYEFIGAGTANMEVLQGGEINGRPTLRFLSKAESNNFIDVFFKVRDFNVATVDEISMASLGFHQNLKEGHYEVIRNTSINYEKGTYEFERTRKGKTNKSKGEIHEPVLDVLSSFFYIRLLKLEPGKEYEVTVFTDEEIYPLLVKVDKDLDTIKVGAGKFECLRVQPFIKGDAIFKAKEGKMLIWLTNDERKMPVLIRSKVAVGAFDAELIQYTPSIP